jgi:hypothetical protein
MTTYVTKLTKLVDGETFDDTRTLLLIIITSACIALQIFVTGQV